MTVVDVPTLFAWLRKLYAESHEPTATEIAPQLTLIEAKAEYQRRMNESARLALAGMRTQQKELADRITKDLQELARRRTIAEAPNQGGTSMSTLGDQLRQIAAQIDAGKNDAALAGAAAMTYPGPNGLAVIDGVVLAIDEPIRSDWKVSMEARVVCSQGRIGAEPSNAFDSGLPKRSPAGYPMIYGVGAFGPMGPGRVKYDGATFANDAEVEAYKATVAKRPSAGSGGDDRVFTGRYSADSIATELEAAAFVYAYTMTKPGSALSNKVYYESGLFSGPAVAIKRLMAAGESARYGRGMSDQQIVDSYPESAFKQAVLAVTV